MTDLILYSTDDGRSRTKLRADQQTVWPTQLEIAERFNVTKQNISLHLKNAFADGEPDPGATVKECLTVQTVGSPTRNPYGLSPLELAENSVVKESLSTTEKSSVVQTEGRIICTPTQFVTRCVTN